MTTLTGRTNGRSAQGAISVGCSNSQPTVKICPPRTWCNGAGVDTCSIAFRPTSERFFDRLRERPHRDGAAGSVVLDERGPGGVRLGAFLGYGVVWVEGRLSALLSGDESCWELGPRADLAVADEVAREALQRAAGAPMFGEGECSDGELRRYDLTFEHAFGDGAEGLAFLRAAGSLLVPGRKTDVWRGPDGQVQTVYWRTPKRGVVSERIYDKGVESGSHAPGERIRIEVQRRPPKPKRQRPGVVARRDLAGEFGRQMGPYLKEDVVAAGMDGAVRELAGRQARGELSMAKAERLIGTLTLLREYGRAVYPDERQQRRRIADIRGCGVAVDEALPAGATVPVGQLLRDAAEAFSA